MVEKNVENVYRHLHKKKRLERMEGKKILVIFDDGGGVSRREGTVTHDGKYFLEINGREFIPRPRIIRIEVIENG